MTGFADFFSSLLSSFCEFLTDPVMLFIPGLLIAFGVVALIKRILS